MSLQRREVLFSGRVQGVGFRYTTQRIASRYPVTGFVRNQPDGRVRLVVEGSAADIESLVTEIEQAMANNIQDTEAVTQPYKNEFPQFEIRR